MMLGRVDEVDGHFVATKFLALTIPVECMYVPRVVTSSRSSATSSLGPLRVKTDWRSVGLAYARVWFPVLAIVVPLVDVLVLGGIHVVMLLLSGALAAGSVAAHRSGRLPPEEQARLRLLGTVTGLRIDPTKLQDTTRAVKRDSLGELMEKGGIPTTAEGIVSVIDDIPMPAMPLVYGYACYAGDDPEWRACAALVYTRHEQGDL